MKRREIVRLVLSAVFFVLGAWAAVVAEDWFESSSVYWNGGWVSIDTSADVDIALGVTVVLFIVWIGFLVSGIAVVLWRPVSVRVAVPGVVLGIVSLAVGISQLAYLYGDYYFDVIEPQLFA